MEKIIAKKQTEKKKTINWKLVKHYALPCHECMYLQKSNVNTFRVNFLVYDIFSDCPKIKSYKKVEFQTLEQAQTYFDNEVKKQETFEY
jgi:hypothetical protein